MGISRASVYYVPRLVSDADLKFMHAMDRLHLKHPFAGSRMLCDLLRQDGFEVGREHRDREHRFYPCLPRGMRISGPNQAWAMDITHIPMLRGFVYPAAVVDWYSRRMAEAARNARRVRRWLR